MEHCNRAVGIAHTTAIDLHEQLTELADSAIRLGMVTLAQELRGVRSEILGMVTRFNEAVNADLLASRKQEG